MPVPVIVAAGCVAAALPLLWWSVASARPSKPARILPRAASPPGAQGDLRQLILTHSAADRAVRPALAGLARRARRLTPLGWIRALEHRLALAGHPSKWPIERVLVAKFLLGLGGLGIAVLEFSTHRSVKWALLGAAVVALGYFTPDLLIYSRGRERQAAIQKELPDTLDQVTISVEAGLGFEAALARAARAGMGPLAEELTRALQEVQIGVPRDQALRNLAERTDVPDLRHFVLAMLQAQAYGVPIAQVLRVQSQELRTKRSQRAEERAMRVPVKIIFPLVTCIFPTMFIVLLGPAIIKIMRALFGVNL
jgi:tight adherence protein C